MPMPGFAMVRMYWRTCKGWLPQVYFLFKDTHAQLAIKVRHSHLINTEDFYGSVTLSCSADGAHVIRGAANDTDLSMNFCSLPYFIQNIKI